jgi:hypothetical protein
MPMWRALEKPIKTNIMRKPIKLIAVVLFLTAFQQLNAQTKIVQITTIESTIAGGLGRSEMIITKEDGSQTETELLNLFSGFGINFGNIKNNEKIITGAIKGYLDQGFKLLSTTPLTLSPATGGNSTGIFMTRYILTKD